MLAVPHFSPIFADKLRSPATFRRCSYTQWTEITWDSVDWELVRLVETKLTYLSGGDSVFSPERNRFATGDPGVLTLDGRRNA